VRSAKAIRVGVFFLALQAAACGEERAPAGPEARPDSGTEQPEQPSAISSTCVLPADCLPIVSPFVNIGVCCGEELRCGFDFSIVEGNIEPEVAAFLGFDEEKPCWPRSKVFFEQPGSPEERVPTPSGTDILVTPACTSRNAANTPLIGCCLPGNVCGVSTHDATSAFSALSEGADEPFTKAECVTPEELNAQLAASVLAAFAHIPPSSGTCDYQDLDARLPR
jgi:hypothetical protein